VLTQLTAWWLGQIRDVPHHMITADADQIVSQVPALREHRDSLEGRAMLARRATVFPVECVVRAYLAGSGWKEYVANGSLGGEPLPPGLLESARLPEPRFTPATKAESGHDENLSRAEARERLGPIADQLEILSRKLFDFGSAVAERAGLILADTKFEFGERDGEVILIDEVMTPDSSRFWARDSYRAGTTPPSFDKQPLRDYLQRLRDRGEWNGEAPGPHIPSDVVSAMSARYLEAFRRITGSPLTDSPLTVGGVA
jgi:phosphoribosylaminoimidazole-succinocarboxamide synthase